LSPDGTIVVAAANWLNAIGVPVDRARRLLATDLLDPRLRTHKLERGECWTGSYACEGRI
jgi:hypothetical protein